MHLFSVVCIVNYLTGAVSQSEKVVFDLELLDHTGSITKKYKSEKLICFLRFFFGINMRKDLTSLQMHQKQEEVLNIMYQFLYDFTLYCQNGGE